MTDNNTIKGKQPTVIQNSFPDIFVDQCEDKEENIQTERTREERQDSPDRPLSPNKYESELSIAESSAQIDQQEDDDDDSVEFNQDSEQWWNNMLTDEQWAAQNGYQEPNQSCQALKRRLQYDLSQFQSEKMTKGVDYINKIKYDVTLDDLYKIEDSCNYTEGNQFCPVILSVGKDIKPQQRLTNYLLQVWDRKGQLLFERQIHNKLKNWGIFDDIFMFQEDNNNDDINILKLRKDAPATLFQIEVDSLAWRNSNQKAGRKSSNNNNEQAQAFDSASMKHQMICYTKNHIFMGFRGKIFYFDISKDIMSRFDDKSLYGKKEKIRITSDRLKTFKLDQKYSFKGFIEAGKNKHDTSDVIMIVENQDTYILTFLKIAKVSINQGVDIQFKQRGMQSKESFPSPVADIRTIMTTQDDGKKLHVSVALRQSGELDFYSDFRLVDRSKEGLKFDKIESNFKAFYFSTEQDEESDLIPKKGKKKRSQIQSVDAKSIANKVYKSSLQWGSLIGMSSKEDVKIKGLQQEHWEYIIHNRVSAHVKLFTDFLMFSNYLLVAHRNLVSAFDIRKKTWEYEFEFDDIVRCMTLDKAVDAKSLIDLKRQNSTFSDRSLDFSLPDISPLLNKKFSVQSAQTFMPTEDEFRKGLAQAIAKSRITLLVGANKIRQIKRCKYKGIDESEFVNVSIPGRVFNYFGDEDSKTLYLLADNNQPTENEKLMITYQDREAIDSFYSFLSNPRPKDNNSNITLYAFTRQHTFTLLDQSQHISSGSILSQQTQITIYNGVTKEDIAKYENNDSAIENFTSQTKIMLANPKSRPRGRKEEDVIDCEIFSVKFWNNHIPKLVLNDEGEYKSDRLNQLHMDYQDIRGAVVLKDPSYKDKQFFTIQITDRGIYIYNRKFTLVNAYVNISIQSIIYMDNAYLYCLCNAGRGTIEKHGEIEGEGVESVQNFDQVSGLYVYDLARLVEDQQVEIYKLQGATVGVNTNLDLSAYNHKISFLKSYASVAIFPVIHRNTMSFLGMGPKTDYLIWRARNGFFTALSKKGFLTTWSIATGHILYSIPVDEEMKEVCKTHVVYQANREDYSHFMSFNSHQNESISLLRNRKYKNKQLADGFDNLKNERLKPKEAMEQHFHEKVQRQKTLKSSAQNQTEKINQQIFEKKQDQNLEVITYTKRAGEFEFRVLKLQTYDDTGDKDQVVELFRFRHKLIIAKDDSGENNVDDYQQKLFLSQNTMRLLEVINGQVGIIYERNECGPESLYVKFEPKKTISQFPRLLMGQNSSAFLFSPNFDRYIDYTQTKQMFIIRTINFENQSNNSKSSDDDQNIIPISTDIVATKDYPHKPVKECIKFLASRMMFVDDKIIRIINEQGIDFLLEIDDMKKDMKLLSFTKVDNFTVYKDSQDIHAFREKKSIKLKDVFLRLLRKNQDQKVFQDQFKITMAPKKPETKIELCNIYELKDQWNEYRKKYYEFQSQWPQLRQANLYTIDYSPKIPDMGETIDSFIAETTFTALDWMILDFSNENVAFNMRDIDHEQQLQICFNIFPECRSILHKIVHEKGDDDDGYTDDQALKDLFSHAKKGFPNDNDLIEAQQALEIPVFEDMMGNTAIDDALGLVEGRGLGEKLKKMIPYHVWYRKMRHGNKSKQDSEEQRKEKLKDKQINMQMAHVIFQEIKDYSYLHSGPYLVEAITTAVKCNVPQIAEFLENRILKYEGNDIATQQYRLQDRASIHSFNNIYGVSQMKIVGDSQSLKKNLFQSSGPKRQMKLEILDIPEIAHLSKIAQNFIMSLAINDDQELFSCKTIQKIINIQWQRTRWWVVSLFFVPLVCQLAIFTYWSHFVLYKRLDGPKEHLTNQIFAWALILISVYFLLVELFQITRDYQNYLKFTNLFDLAPNIMLIVNCSRAIWSFEGRQEDHAFWMVNSIIGLLIWLKFLIFLRIFEYTGHLIYMLSEVFKKLVPFIIVTIISIVGFADSFHSLSRIYPEPLVETYLDSFKYSIMLTLGDFDVEKLDELGWILFLAAALFNLIILLNLVIAIISEVFTELYPTKEPSFFKERVSLIADMWMLVPVLADEADSKLSLLFFATENNAKQIIEDAEKQKEDEEEERKEQQKAKISEIHQMVLEMKQKEDDKDDQLGDEEIKSQQETQNLNITELVLNMKQNHNEVNNKLKSIVKKVNKLMQDTENTRTEHLQYERRYQ